jgi:hypothetical protein
MHNEEKITEKADNHYRLTNQALGKIGTKTCGAAWRSCGADALQHGQKGLM